MGQAFDRDGNVLGEAFGETKRDVLDQLERMHPAAEEIRIKSAALLEDMKKANAQVLMRDRMEQFFAFEHLPPPLQAVSKPFGELAAHIIATVPGNPERTVALRKLLEAKDCAVRALIYKG